MKQVLLPIAVLATIAVYYFWGFHGVIGLWMFPVMFIVGSLVLFTLWKMFKYAFLIGILLLSGLTFILIVLRIAFLF